MLAHVDTPVGQCQPPGRSQSLAGVHAFREQRIGAVVKQPAVFGAVAVAPNAPVARVRDQQPPRLFVRRQLAELHDAFEQQMIPRCRSAVLIRVRGAMHGNQVIAVDLDIRNREGLGLPFLRLQRQCVKRPVAQGKGGEQPHSRHVVRIGQRPEAPRRRIVPYAKSVGGARQKRHVHERHVCQRARHGPFRQQRQAFCSAVGAHLHGHAQPAVFVDNRAAVRPTDKIRGGVPAFGNRRQRL